MDAKCPRIAGASRSESLASGSRKGIPEILSDSRVDHFFKRCVGRHVAKLLDFQNDGLGVTLQLLKRYIVIQTVVYLVFLLLNHLNYLLYALR